MFYAILPALLVMFAAVLMVSLARANGMVEPSRPPKVCPSCGRKGHGRDGCSCAR